MPPVNPPGKPNPVLLKLGFTGDAVEFKDKMLSYVDEYQRQYGYQPSPDKALADVIEGSVPKPVVLKKAASEAEKYRNQLAQIKTGSGLIEKANSTLDDPDVVKAVASAARQGRAKDVVVSRVKEIRALNMNGRMAVAAIVRAESDKNVALPWQLDPSQDDPKKSVPMDMADNVVAFRIRNDLRKGVITRADALAQWYSHTEEMRDRIANPGTLGKIVGLPGLAAQQIAEGAINTPGGLYTTGKAVVLDARDLADGKAPTRTPEIAKAMATQIKEDFTNPLENPGYLLMDILGGIGAGAGFANRLGTATATARSGAGAAATVKAGLKRPISGSYQIMIGDTPAYVRLSDNPARAFVQKWRLAGKQARSDATRAGTSAGALHAVMPPKVERYLSAERKARRAWDRDAEIQKIIDMEGPRELQAAAGWVRSADSILSRVKPEGFRGISVGEQKLIFSSAIDDPTPIATQIKAHQNLIRDGVGDPRNHSAQIEALYTAADLAKKSGLDDLADGVVFPDGWASNAKPSKRFLDTLDKTRELVTEQEVLKIKEFGLTPEIATARVAKMGAVYRQAADAAPGENVRSVAAIRSEMNKLQKQRKADAGGPGVDAIDNRLTALKSELEAAKRRDAIVDADADAGVKVPERALYMPGFVVDRGTPKGQTRGVTVRRGQFGLPRFEIKRTNPELNHEFTGDSIRLGTIRLDTTNVVAEVAGSAFRGALIKQEYERMVGAGVEKFTREMLTSGDYVAVRKVSGVPDDLRKIFLTEETALTPDELAALGRKESSALWKRLVPDVDEVFENPDQFVAVPVAAIPPGARTLKTLSPGAQAALQKVNFPIRMSYFFTRPAYALNVLGNAGMTIIQQGVFAPPNLYKALRAKEIYGGKNARTMAALMGSGKVLSYIDEAYSLRAERNIAHAWGKLNDEKFRMGALIHEMNRRGYKTVDEIDNLLHSTDDATRVIRNEAVEAARASHVNFTNLNPFEAEVLKHIIFVYPWMSRSLVWSIDTMLDRPITSDFLIQLGEMQSNEDPIWEAAPRWFKKMGYFSVGWNDDGTPKVLNASNVNTFMTLGDMVNLVEGAFTRDGSQASSLLGPLAQFTVSGVTGRNQFGQSYEGSAWVGAATDVLVGLPQLSAYMRGSKNKDAKAKPFEITDRESLLKKINSGLDRTVFTPGWLNGYGALLASGFSPRGVDEEAKFARYRSDLPVEERNNLDLTLLNMALDRQANALGRGVPEQVREAVQLGAALSFDQSAYLEDNPTATPRDLTERAIAFLEERGRLSKDAAAAKRKEMVRGRFDAKDHDLFRSSLVSEVTSNVLAQWDQDVRSIALFRAPDDGGEDVLQQRLDFLASQGFVAKKKLEATPEERIQAGREYVKYRTDRILLEREIDDPRTSEADRIKLRAEALALDDKYDKPFVVDGREVLPSILRIAWTDLDPRTQAAHKAAAVQKPWGSLSKFDKDVVGRKVSDEVQEGWEAYTGIVARYRAENPGESLDKDQRRAVAEQIEQRGAKGFVKDFEFSERSLAERIVDLDAYRKSGFKKDWDEILAKAKTVVEAVRDGSADSAGARGAWKDWVTNVYRVAQRDSPGFYSELLRYDRILYKLVG